MSSFQFLCFLSFILIHGDLITTAQTSPPTFRYNFCDGSNYTRNSPFHVNLNLLLSSLSSNATPNHKFYKTSIGLNPADKVYGLFNCKGYVTANVCKNCVDTASKDITERCPTKKESIIYYDECMLRYSNRSISNDMESSLLPPQLPPPLPPPLFTDVTITDDNGMNSSQIIVIVVVPSVIALVILSIITIYFYSRWRTKKTDDDGEGITSVESLQFDFDTIEAATDSFSDANKIGKGGFGAVYKGRLSHGQEIAVKRLSRHSGQGEEQFKNEVLLVAKLQHRNLVKLLGFCIKGEERLLIYEFVPNTSLDHFVFDPIKCASLNWEMRHKIIGGIARGLLYLHEDSRHRIIHRDLKVGNILLDAAMNPKISDFGMARLFVPDQTEGSTDRIVGTYGYMSPEYAMHGQFSVKSDVYSFGVLLLEIVCGQKNNSFYESERFENLLTYAWRHWNEGTALELMDPTMRDSFSTGEVIRCIHVGLLCVQDNLADRPTMASVVLMLGSYYSGSLAVPLRPAFCLHRINSNTPISNLKACSVNEVSNTEIYPR